MPEIYSKVEIVRPPWKPEEWASRILQAIFALAFATLIVWWFFAAWFPELGLTWWQLVLPVYAIRVLLSRQPLGRQLTK